ncbi:MAG: tripartite tricarboxylate transporter substrate binding protein [Burkholderiales bacterium]|nr:tripartite tricarboxylate transporter substrate binding protein [Burkholderiales bacterium]
MRMLLAAALVICSSAFAQTWPAKPVRVIVGYPAGGGHDFTARVVATRLSEVLKQQFVVENRPGASGTIATDGIAKGPADGYSFIVASPAETVVGAVAGLRMAYDWEKDLAAVTVIGDTALAIAVHPKTGINSIRELLDFAKKNPGKLSYGTPGSGSSQHFAGESLKTLAGAFIVHIPYRGAAPAVTDLLGGQVEVGIVGMPPVIGPHKAGKIRIVAVTSEKRAAATPDIPAMAELPGFQGYSFTNWTGVFMAAATPRPIIERIAAEIGQVVREPAVRERLIAAGVEPLGLTTADAMKFFEREKATYARLAKARNIKAED